MARLWIGIDIILESVSWFASPINLLVLTREVQARHVPYSQPWANTVVDAVFSAILAISGELPRTFIVLQCTSEYNARNSR